MTTSSLDLSQKTELQWLAELIADARSAANNVEWVIVGALARDLHLTYAHGIPIQRATTDTDLALAVTDWTEFSSVRTSLIGSGAFTPDPRKQHRLIHRKGQRLDIVPFGGIEDSIRVITWPPVSGEKMNVLGYQEAVAGSLELGLPFGQRARVVALPALIMLKLIAWSERHFSAPGKDAFDLRILLENYLDAGNLDRLYAEHGDLVEEDFEFPLASAHIAECQRLVKGYSDTYERGLSNYRALLEAIDRIADRPDLSHIIRKLRNAALADEEGQRLQAALSELEQPASVAA